MQHSKWLAKFGSGGYDLLILLNSLVNFILTSIGGQKYPFQEDQEWGESAVSYINKFEETAAGMPFQRIWLCHLRSHPSAPDENDQQRAGSVTYLNSGDWVENLSALEYHKGNGISIISGRTFMPRHMLQPRR